MMKREPQSRLGKLGVVLAFAGFAPIALAVALSLDLNPRYQQALNTVMAGDLELRRHFAEIALRALIGANHAEIARAGSGAPAGRWQAGAVQFVARLERVHAQLDALHDIVVFRERRGNVRLALGTEQVMLSPPRLSTQGRFEAAIAEELCREITCTEPSPDLADPVTTYTRNVRQEWLFSDQGPPVMSASDGLNCTFDDTRHLRLKQTACEGVMNELRMVAEGLRAVTEHGEVVAWEEFAIKTDPLDAALRVTYDAEGAFFNVELRYLVQAPALWREAIPWMQARLRGYAGYYMIKAPERLAYVAHQ